MLIVGTAIPAAAAADDCQNAEIRVQQGMEHLPDCMALEMVSPPAKDSQPARIHARGPQGEPDTMSVSPGGDRVLFHSNAPLGGSSGVLQTVSGGDYYVASREGTEQRWTTSHTTPPAGLIRGGIFGLLPNPSSFSADLSRWFQIAASDTQMNAGLGRVFLQGLGGSSLPFSPMLVPVEVPLSSIPAWTPVGASADSSHLFFTAKFVKPSQNVPPAAAAYFVGDPKPAGAGSAHNAYVAHIDPVGGPSLALLARDGTGRVWGGNCGVVVGSDGGGPTSVGAISADGSRAYLTTRPGQATNSVPGGPIVGNCDSASNKRRIMVRRETSNGIEIEELVESECDRVAALPAVPACGTTGPSGTPIPDSDDSYQGASIDGSKVYFTSSRQLADSDVNGIDSFGFGISGCSGSFIGGCDLYLYDASRPPGQRLTQVTADSAGQTLPTIEAVSGDGARVYFRSSEVLTDDPGPGGVTAQAGQSNLYVYSRNIDHPQGKIAFIANSPAIGRPAWAVPLLGPDPMTIGVGGNGRWLVFGSRSALTADDTDGSKVDVFRYDAQDATLTRISKAVPGGADNGPVDVTVNERLGLTGNSPDYVGRGRWVSDDGETIAFKTAEGLVPADTNGLRDSYLWRRGELLRLPGTSDLSEFGLDDLSLVSVDGSTVAFQTVEQLLPADRDYSIDVYVARVDGGFLAPAAQGESCDVQAGSCQGAGSSPVDADARTSSGAGDGNVVLVDRKRLAITGLSRRARRLAARRGVLLLRVRSNRAGLIRIRARGRIGKRTRQVGKASKRLAKPGASTVRLRLDRQAKRALRHGDKLVLAIEARSPGARARSVTVALRRPQS